MKRLIILFLISCSLLTITSCKKKNIIIPEPTLPAVTQEGLNTFGFMFGKELWIPLSGLAAINPGFPALSAKYSTHTSGLVLEFECRRQSPVSQDFRDAFFFQYKNSSLATGTYDLDAANCRVDVVVTKADKGGKEFVLIDKGSITITRWDIKNRIGSGTFSMSLREKTTGETLSITQGRFDVMLGN
jgi:hypothetical protein